MFKKGKSGNPGGRHPGAKNKMQSDIKKSFQQLVEGNLTNIETWLDKVSANDPAKAIDIVIRLSEYILPKMKSIEMKAEVESPNSFVIIVQNQEAADEIAKLG